jgi:hypothetical protein
MSPIRSSFPLLALLGALAGWPSAGAAGPAPREPRTVARAVAEAEQRRGEVAAWPGGSGLALGVFSDGDGKRYRQDLEEVAALGASHVLIVVQHAQVDVTSVAIRPLPWLTPSEERLEDCLAHARALGLGVVLMPTILVEVTSDAQWRGTIAPTSWTTWWRSYERFLLHHARLAEKHGVDVLVVGSELVSTESQRSSWARLILKVRAVTRARIAYSFNWDHHSPGAIHDLLDLVGVNSYFDLGPGPDTPEEVMVSRLVLERDAVRALLRRVGRPLLVTEVGYRSIRGAEVNPWDHASDGAPYDGEAQARCYRATLATWGELPELKGLFAWWWRGDGGPGDTTYTPRGKPAEDVLRSWLAQRRAPSGR